MSVHWGKKQIDQIGEKLTDEERQDVFGLCKLIYDYRKTWPLDFEIRGFVRVKLMERAKAAADAMGYARASENKSKHG